MRDLSSLEMESSRGGSRVSTAHAPSVVDGHRGGGEEDEEYGDDVGNGGGLTMELLATVNFYVKEYLDRSELFGTSETFSSECRRLNLPVQNLSEEEDQEDEVVTRETERRLLNAFDGAYDSAFFSEWEDPSAVPHQNDISHVRINLRLRLYFSCRQLSEGLAPASECLAAVREFLDREGGALSGEQEFMHFFALPFVANPQQHPSFAVLFQPATWSRLRSDLLSYLHDLRLSGRFNSHLVRLVLAHTWQQQNAPGAVKKPDLFRQFAAREREASRVRRRHAQLMASHQQLRRDYQKLIAVTKELTGGLEMVAKSAQQQQQQQQQQQRHSSAKPGSSHQQQQESSVLQSIQWDVILGNCSRIYPELFPPLSPSARGRRELPRFNGELLQENQQQWTQARRLSTSSSSASSRVLLGNGSSASDSPAAAATTSSLSSMNGVALGFIPALVAGERRLDYAKVKKDLVRELEDEDVPRRKMLLLQALRWLLTHSSDGDRFAVLDQYLNGDLLGLKQEPQQNDQQVQKKTKTVTLRESLMLSLLPSDVASWRRESNEVVTPAMATQSAVARLLNAIASVRKGRDYLASYTGLVETLIDCLIALGTKKQRKTIEMIVATLQKLSLKCAIRKQMIERGVLEWLISYLQDQSAHTSYGLEYSTALFMNLCLHKSGRDRCSDQAKAVISIFSGLLTREDAKEVLPYANGTLFSLLAQHKFVEAAREMEMLSPAGVPKKDGQRKQLDYILEQIDETSNKNEKENSVSDDDDDNSVDEDIDIEEEIDFDDPVVPAEGETFGTELLEKHYLLNADEPSGSSENSLSTEAKSQENSRAKKDADGKKKEPDKKEKTDEVKSEDAKPVLKRPGTATIVPKPKEKDDKERDSMPVSTSSDEGVVMVKGDKAKKEASKTVTKEEIIPLKKTEKQSSMQRRNSEVLPKLSSSKSGEQNVQNVAAATSPTSLNSNVPLPPVPSSSSSSSTVTNKNKSQSNASKSSVAKGKEKSEKESEADAEETVHTIQGKAVLPPLSANTETSSVSRQNSTSTGSTTRPVSRARRRRGTSESITSRQQQQQQQQQLQQQSSRSSSAVRRAVGEKRPISNSFPYNPLRRGEEAYNAVFAPKPRVARSPPQSAAAGR